MNGNQETKTAKIAKNILFLGLVSFFADISSEMVYPIIPLYLTAAFGATPVLVGIIEGVAESLASLLKVFSGYMSDKFNKKKPLAFFGYSTGLLYKVALLIASSWLGILAARIIDRLGKGIRTAPRDVMIAESAAGGKMGKSFGIHKALDMAGSAIGIIASFFLLKSIGTGGYKTIFAISAIPVVLALLMFFFVKETGQKREQITHNLSFRRDFAALDGSLKLYLLVSFLFTLGNSSNTFLLLKANSIGFSSTDVILLYFVYNITSALLAIPFGRLSDRIGRKKLLIAGYLTFSLVYFGFAFATSKLLLILIFVIYGIYTALVAGVERAYIAEIAPSNIKGTMLGLHSTLVGIALLPASIIAGILWDGIGSFAPFCFGALLSATSAIILAFFFKPKNTSKDSI